MTNDKTMKYITDRVCFNVLADFNCSVIIDPASFKIKTIQSTLKKEILKHLTMPQQLGVTVPFFQLNTFNYFIEETVEKQPDNIMTVSAQCNCEICFEECENDPIKSAQTIIEAFFLTMGSDKDLIKSGVAYNISIKSPVKGYIQANQTLFFPEKL